MSAVNNSSAKRNPRITAANLSGRSQRKGATPEIRVIQFRLASGSRFYFFLVAASAAIKSIGLRHHGYSYLSHPSLKNYEEAKAEARIGKFLTGVLDTISVTARTSWRALNQLTLSWQATLGDKTP